jgi:glycosyltransferase involved in cell wall biosynthesis
MYPPHHLGGYELVWRSAMRHLRAGGHEARVLTTDFRLAGIDEDDEAEVYRELRWYWREHAWPRRSWRERVALERHNAAVLERQLREFAPDVVAWWSMGGMSLSLLERVRRRSLPAIGFVADDWLVYGPLVDQWTRPFRSRRGPAGVAERLTGLPARVSLDDAARYVLISEAVRGAARASGLRLPDSTIAHLGVDPAFLDPRPERPWRWCLLYVGRLDPRKGVEDAIAALSELPPEATLRIAGDGDPGERRRLQELVERRRLGERVQLLGARSHAELPELYDAADAVLFPVRWSEPWGIVPLEAMGFARPVIATGRGGSGEYLRDGENAVIVPPERPAALAAAVRRLHGAPELRARLRAGGLATARTHTETVFNEAVEAALGDAIATGAEH